MITDAVLQQDLQRKLHTRAVLVDVHQGIATLSGRSIDPLIAWDAVSKVAGTPGVRGIVDNMTVGTSAEAKLGPMP